MKKITLALAIVAALSGCANLQFQWSASYMTDDLKAALESANNAKK